MKKQIKDFPNYTISKDGLVLNTKTNTEKTQSIGKNGYKYVTLYHENYSKLFYIHRLVMLYYVDNVENKRTVNHKDGNKLNNSLSNLEWATDSENIKHAYDTGLNKGSSKVTDEHLQIIYTRFFKGETLTEISKDLPYNNVTVSNHFTRYIDTLGEHDKRAKQEKLNISKRMKSAGFNKRKQITLQMIDKTTNTVLNVFNSIAEARNFLNKKSSGPISNVLANRQKSAYGYYWRKI